MSMQFSDLVTRKGIVQMAEKEMGLQRGTISGNDTRLQEFTADVNLAMDDFIDIALKSSGTWQFDDSNQTDYPIITTNLVSGQRDYPMTADADGNLILDVYKVFVANSAGLFIEILAVDVNTGKLSQPGPGVASGFLAPTGLQSFTNGQNASGIPYRYDKLGNAIFLDPIPNYNYANGLKVYINREGSYFLYTDTTKKPGVPGLFHRYFAIKPALDYARRNNLANYTKLLKEVISYEGDEEKNLTGSIAAYFSKRPKDERPRMSAGRHSNK